MPQAIRKLINDPERIAPELLEGVVAACHGRVKQAGEPPIPGALVKARLRKGKVGLVIGGVCGHEPLFSMLIGDNLADGAACGGVYNAPDPEVIVATTRAVDRGRGVLYVYGNWRSNVERFGQAEKMAAEAGVETRTVRVRDDIASAPLEQIQRRSGIAGDLLVIKVAGAVTAQTDRLDEAFAVTARARDNTRSIAVVLSSGSIPGTGELLYAMPEGQIEIGGRLHGRGAVLSSSDASADRIVQSMMDQILAEGLFAEGDEVYLLINDLGAMSHLEMLIANREVRRVLRDRGVAVRETVIGSYFTCQETAGFSITMMRLDEELRRYVDAPADSLGFSTVGRANW